MCWFVQHLSGSITSQQETLTRLPVGKQAQYGPDRWRWVLRNDWVSWYSMASSVRIPCLYLITICNELIMLFIGPLWDRGLAEEGIMLCSLRIKDIWAVCLESVLWNIILLQLWWMFVAIGMEMESIPSQSVFMNRLFLQKHVSVLG